MQFYMKRALKLHFCRDDSIMNINSNRIDKVYIYLLYTYHYVIFITIILLINYLYL